LTLILPLPARGAKGHDRTRATLVAPFTLPVSPWSLPVIASNTTPHNGNEEHQMITETQTCIIVLQLTDEQIVQLRPFRAGLDITATAHNVEPSMQRLTLHGEVYATLVERVGSALDHDIRWQPNEYEPEGFVERMRPLELTNGILVPTDCSHCGAHLLTNRAEVSCACGHAVSLS
jgi:hypothetical protein